MAKLEDNLFALSISFIKQHVKNRKDVLNVLEATFGTSIHPTWWNAKIALASGWGECK